MSSGQRDVGNTGDDAAHGVEGNVVTVAISSGTSAATAATASLAGMSVTAASSAAFDFSTSALTRVPQLRR